MRTRHYYIIFVLGSLMIGAYLNSFAFPVRELYFTDFEDRAASPGGMALDDMAFSLISDPEGRGILSIQGQSGKLHRGPIVTIPAGNRGRGVRLTLAARKPSGSMRIRLRISKSGVDTSEVECTVRNTYADRWCQVGLELELKTDEETQARVDFEAGEVDDIRLSLIEAAANSHYGDNITLDYDRDLRLRKIERKDGTSVAGIVYGDTVVASGECFGEFSARFESTSREYKDCVLEWGGMECAVSEDGKKMTMSGAAVLKRICAQIGVKVEYEVVNAHVIKKTIGLTHLRGPNLLHSLESRLSGEPSVDSFWSWRVGNHTQDAWLAHYEDWPLGEDFPAVGYRPGDLTVGLLTDNGADNGWSRVYRAWENDPQTGAVSGTVQQRNVADKELFGVFPSSNSVAMKFGCFYYQDENRVEPYHPLFPGQCVPKTLFIFVDEGIDSTRKLRLACQTRLAEGKGFQGSTVEKILFADQQMLTGTFDHYTLETYVHPSRGYQMIYFRDAFWQTGAMYHQQVAEDVWNIMLQSMDRKKGGISCNQRPYTWYPGIPGGHTEANLMHLIMAYINHVRYGTVIDPEYLDLNLEWIRKTFTRPGEESFGQYWTVSAGWFDVLALSEPALFAHMQGKYMVALRCARLLGANIEEGEIGAAEQVYRDFYDSELGYMVFGKGGRMVRNGEKPDFEILLSPTVLMGEFLSLWLFDRPVLTDEMVHNTLDKIDEVCGKRWAEGYAQPNIIRSDGTRFTQENKMYAEQLYWQPGIYHNGGSWLLYEYLAYAVGQLHGWMPKYVGKSALHRMAMRLELEISEKDQPVSHEFLPMTEQGINTPGSVWDGTDDTGVSGPPGSFVFGWNTFILIANELVGLRRPEDPFILDRGSRAVNSISGKRSSPVTKCKQ